MIYKVEIWEKARPNEKEFGQSIVTICYTRQQLSDLLANLDEEKYEVEKVDADHDVFEENYLKFCKKDDKLETGKEKE